MIVDAVTISEAGAGLLVRYGDIDGLSARIDSLLYDDHLFQAIVTRGKNTLHNDSASPPLQNSTSTFINESSMKEEPSFPVRRILWIALCILLIIIYYSSLHADFVYDDKIECYWKSYHSFLRRMEGDPFIQSFSSAATNLLCSQFFISRDLIHFSIILRIL